MLIQLFQGQSRTLLTKTQMEKLDLLEVNLNMLNHKITYHYEIGNVTINNENEFYIYYNDYRRIWHLKIQVNEKITYQKFNSINELIDEIINEFIN